MCIRDSLISARHRARRQGEGARVARAARRVAACARHRTERQVRVQRVGQHQGAGRRRTGHLHAQRVLCLLYTSRCVYETGAHLAGMGSLEAIATEKGSIYTGLDEDGIAVFNADDG